MQLEAERWGDRILASAIVISFVRERASRHEYSSTSTEGLLRELFYVCLCKSESAHRTSTLTDNISRQPRKQF